MYITEASCYWFQLLNESEKNKDPVHKLRKEGEKIYSILGEIIGKVSRYVL